jgi:5'-nucleotidase
VNHFKSKGSSGASGSQADQKDGQGVEPGARRSGDRAARLGLFDHHDGEAAVLVGDFNSYTQEDPLKVLYDAGYTDAESALKVGRSTTRSTVSRARSTTCC